MNYADSSILLTKSSGTHSVTQRGRLTDSVLRLMLSMGPETEALKRLLR